MAWVRRVALAIVIVGVRIGAYAAWYVYGAWPVPAGYSFPRHSIWGGGPTGLFEGSLQESGGCIRTAGTTHATVVWPPGYRLSLDAGQPVVIGSGRAVRMDEAIRIGGGFDDEEPPPTSFEIGTCQPPYFLSTGFEED